MNFDVPPCGRLIWRVLPLLCVYPGIFLQQPSTNSDGPLPCSAVLSYSFKFMSNPRSLPTRIFQPLLPSSHSSLIIFQILSFLSYLSVSMLGHLYTIFSIHSALPCFSPLFFTMLLSNLLFSFPSDMSAPLFPLLNSDLSTYAPL